MSDLLRRLAEAATEFLEIIGLRDSRRVDQEAQLDRFRLYHSEFRKLLSANNAFLETLADLELRLRDARFCDPGLLRRRTRRLAAEVGRMIAGINVIGDGRYPALLPVKERIEAEVAAALAELPAGPAETLVRDLPDTSACDSDLVGGKMANLGEVRNLAGLPTPDGFTVTAAASRLFFERVGLPAVWEKLAPTTAAPDEFERFSRVPAERILDAEIPAEIGAEIAAATARLRERRGHEPLFAVRSSAIGEDTHLSFAGQFLSVLNVAADGLGEAWRQVLASLFSPEAAHYRALHGLSFEDAAMGVGVIEMIDAVAAGVVYTNDPNHPDPGRVVVTVVRGLGVMLVDGRASPEVIYLGREDRQIQSRQSACQAEQARGAGPTVIDEPVPEGVGDGPILTDDEARALAEWALALEKHFAGPQDIEWAMDRQRRMFILQSRPLRVRSVSPPTAPEREGFAVIVRGGTTASPGLAAGPAFFVTETSDFESFPRGAVLVARRSSPKYVRLMDRAVAIVADAGSVTGHMAALAREFRLPALLGARGASEAIVPGETITVDATGGVVYRGELPDARAGSGLLSVARGPQAGAPELPPPVRRAVDLIVPLRLINPNSPSFRPESCATLHDLTRFIHEKSYEEMFRLGESLGDFRGLSWHLDVFLPIDLYIIDIGGGVNPPGHGRKVKPRHITSAPLSALLRGMLHHDIPRFGPRPLDAGGFAGLVMRHALSSPEEDRTFRDPSYAIVSDVYVNFTSRVGYHFGVVDSYCGRTANKNYIHILFRGGAADITRKSRRAVAIGAILREHGFTASIERDLVTARITKTTTEGTVARLEMVGRLLQFMRQMDVAMVSDEVMRGVVEAFLAGDYGLVALRPKK